MTKPTVSPICFADEPNTWPSLPAKMSYYRLRECERCPRRAALKTANYPALWQRSGYPPKLGIAALFGQVVHDSVGRISYSLAATGCTGPHDARAVQALKELGGYTAVIRSSLAAVLDRYADNPRVVGDRMLERLEPRIPEIREQVQMLTGRLRVNAIPASRSRRSALRKTPLQNGAYFELELQSHRLMWRGVPDYLELSDNGCEIVDFKTGEPDVDHADQLRVYATLWARDSELNPSGRLATKLALSYPRGVVEVPAPTKLDINKLEKELIDRTAYAKKSFAKSPPEAKPCPENCDFCDVRQLCGEYWSQEGRKQVAQSGTIDQKLADVKLRLISSRGHDLWNSEVVSSPTLSLNHTALLHTQAVTDVDIRPLLSPGCQVAILGAHVGLSNEPGSPAVITLIRTSEAFLLRSRDT